ncbi:MAG: DUF3696 domain-containing protein [Candidatus Cloacimonadaceae bacterium]
MLNKIRIENFKCWKDTGDIRLAPLTLLFGANSSGKSSIGQFLMMLKQTVDSPDQKSPLFVGHKNTAVNLGSYFDIIHNRDKNNAIRFKYQWDLDSPVMVRDTETDAKYQVDEVCFKAEIKIVNHGNKTIYVDWFNYGIPETGSGSKEELQIEIGMQRESQEKNEYMIKTTGIELKRNVGRAWSLGSPIKYYGFPGEVEAYHKNAGFVRDLNLANERLFRRVYYLGPLRISAERTYPWTGTAPDSVGYSGENTISALLAAESRKLNFGKNMKRYPFQEIIAMQLKEMGLIDDFKMQLISERRMEYEAKIKTKGSNSFVDLPDVGFGISQVLPVLTQIFYAPENSIIIMEQPEIHLHPSAQAVLADVMIDALNSTENGRKRNIQLIIESHSEHFLRRLQRRIAENDKSHKSIDAQDVAVYFSEFGDNGSQLHALDVDEFGSILNWPENFFGDEMADIAAQSKAVLNRRLKEMK